MFDVLVKQKDLARAAKAIAACADGSVSHIAGNVGLYLQANSLILHGTDTMAWLDIELPAVTPEPHATEALVNAGLAAKVFGNIDGDAEGRCRLFVHPEHGLTASGKDGVFKIPVIAATAWPEPAAMTSPGSVANVPAEPLRLALDAVLGATTQAELSKMGEQMVTTGGVQLEPTTGGLRCTTFSPKGMMQVSIGSGEPLLGNGLIASKNAESVIQLLSGFTGLANLMFDSQRIRLQANDITYTTTQLHGKLPAYKPYFAAPFSVTVAVNAKELEKALRRSLLIRSAKDFQQVELKLESKSIQLSTVRGQGHYSTTIPLVSGEWAGEPMSLYFSASSLLSVVNTKIAVACATGVEILFFEKVVNGKSHWLTQWRCQPTEQMPLSYHAFLAPLLEPMRDDK